MVNFWASSCVQCRKLIRLLALDCMKCNRRIFVRYVRSKLNFLADALSRGRMHDFWKKAPITMSKRPDELPLSIWPVEKLWNTEVI